MKKILQGFLSIVLALLMFSAQAMAYTSTASTINTEDEIAAVVDFDEAEIYNAFGEVNDLVSALETNDELSFSSLEASESDLITNVSSSAAIAMSSTMDDTPPFISAFLWGCIFNLAGMVIVGITTDFDSEQLTKSAWGCLISSLLIGGSRYPY